MSLVGNLEDLGLGEILQIVSLSRKTGVLTLHSREREGSVFFRQGQVVRASSSTYQQSLGEVLIQKGVIDLAILRKALSFQQENNFTERLGVILVKNFGVCQDIIEDVVREQIENVVFSLFAWAEGSFNFEVRSAIETVDGTRMDPLQFMTDQGLNPQFLAMEGTRILDEKRHAIESGSADYNEESGSDDFEFDLVGSVSGASEVDLTVPRPVVIVDDDGPTLRAISEGLTAAGLTVHAMTRSEDTLIKVDSLHRCGEKPVVLIDLIMPKMDGSGVLGGLELLDLLHNNFKELQLLVMTDYHHADAESKIRAVGCQYIVKPRRAELSDTGLVEKFVTGICAEINGIPAEIDQDVHQQERFNLGDELRIEMGEDDDVPTVSDSPQHNSGLSLLRGMLEELNNPELQGGVLLLVLRFASEFMNRAIVFTVHDSLISGSGQFGITGGSLSGDERVRAINFPVESRSIFSEPYRTGQALTCVPERTPQNMHLFEQLGGGFPDEVFIGPLVSQSRVIGFLYGDNIPENRPIGDTETLAIFLAQAGIAMEKSLLERQLNERAIV